MIHYIRFEGSITAETTSRLVDALARAKHHQAEKIVVIFSSLGGSIYDGFLLASVIENSKIPIAIHATNHVDSIANVVYLSSAERTSESYARFYLHGASTSERSMDERGLLDQLSSLRANNHRIAHFISEHSRLALNRVKKIMTQGVTFSAHDALKAGIVHKLNHLCIDTKAPLEEIIFVLPNRRNGDPQL